MTSPDFDHPLADVGLPEPAVGSRAVFPNLAARAYLAHAAISPACLQVTRAVQRALAVVEERGVGSFPLLEAQRERLRESLGALWSVDAEHIALTPGCTRGITDVALAFDYSAGDVLLTYEGEFPANVIPWQVAARARGARIELLPLPAPTDPECGPRILEELRSRLAQAGSRVRWVAASAVQFQTGLRMPLAEMAAICREYSVRFLVDGIQASGVVPLDLGRLGVDAFFVGAHKWHLGVEGVGAAFLKEDFMKELSPLTVGWLSLSGGDQFLFRGTGYLDYERPHLTNPRVLEGSTQNALGFVALEAGIEVVRHVGPGETFLHVQRYHDRVEGTFVRRGFQSLRAADPGLRSCLLSFRAPDGVDVPRLSAALRSQGVVVSTPDGLVRVAPHFANSLEELDLVDEALGVAMSCA